VIADRSWAAEARAAGWELEASFERRVHQSLTRYVMVLERRSS
jgi:tRNA (guanine10-N2)-dimethyltransferase